MSNEIKPIVSTLRQIFGAEYITPISEALENLKLDNVYIQLTPCDNIQLDIDGDNLDHDKLINKCKDFLISYRGDADVLLKGYRVAKDNNVASNIYTSSSNFSNTFIRSHQWRLLHSLIGSSKLAHILVNYNVFMKKDSEYVQICGKNMFNIATNRSRRRDLFSLKSCLYKNHSQAKRYNPLPPSRKELIQRIFQQQLENVKNYHKFESKIRGFSKLLTTLMSNHQKFPYFRCFDEICREGELKDDVLSLSIPKENVIRFCSVVFDSIFPKGIYGSSHNKSVILRNMSFLILGNKDAGLEVTDLSDHIKLKDIQWLGKHTSKKWNKQDHEARYNRFTCFLGWLFSDFFNNLLASFFHITHISSSKDLLYFRHSSWYEISRDFFQKYRNENLVKLTESNPKENSNNFEVRCLLRVMPKKNNDFRVINVPLKGRNIEQQADYHEYIKKEVRPTRQILSQARLLEIPKFPRLTSVTDVPLLLSNFKKMLYAQYGTVPLLYFIKFDAEKCYDNLPKDIIKSCTSKLISDDVVYYLNSTSNFDLVTQTVKNVKNLATMDTVSESLHKQKRSKTLRLGSDYVVSLCGEEIKAIVDSQVDQAYTIFNNKSYGRQKGVFQGLHLSSIFCDLVYDKLVYDKFEFLEPTESLVLRLADDFLIISTNKTSILQVKKMISLGFEEYGMKVNKLKTFLNFSSGGYNEQESKVFSFCGYDINISNLAVLKQYETIGLSNFRSHKKLTQKLLWLFKIRLSSNTLKFVKTNDAGTVLKQVFILVTNLAKSYQQGTKKITPTVKNFGTFFNQIIEDTLNVISSERTDVLLLKEVKITIIQAFLIILKHKHTKLCKVIQFLEKMLIEVY